SGRSTAHSSHAATPPATVQTPKQKMTNGWAPPRASPPAADAHPPAHPHSQNARNAATLYRPGDGLSQDRVTPSGSTDSSMTHPAGFFGSVSTANPACLAELGLERADVVTVRVARLSHVNQCPAASRKLLRVIQRIAARDAM